MSGPCSNCSYDPGFEWVVCPKCGARPGTARVVLASQAPRPRRIPKQPIDGDAGAVFLVTSGPDRGRTATIGDELSIGREAEAGLCLSDPHVSRDHARVRCVSGRYVYQDLRGANGSYLIVGKRRVPLREPHTLHDDDQIAVGQSVMRFIEIHGEEGR